MKGILTAIIIVMLLSTSGIVQGGEDIKQVIEDVTSSTGYKYGAKDDMGNSMDTLKIIENPNGGYIGVYHTLIGGSLIVKLATSTDILNWKYRTDLQDHASQPTIALLSDGSFLVAMESDNHGSGQTEKTWIRFKHYSNIDNLLSGISDRTFDAPHTLVPPDSGAEGTPNIYSVTLSPDLDHSVMDIGFHYFMNGDVDRQARGTLTNFNTWTTRIEDNVNNAITHFGVNGNIGDRDNIIYDGKSYNIIEGQFNKNDWYSWRVFLYSWSDGVANQLNIKTHKGSTAFANPSFTKIKDPRGNPVLVVALFVPTEGSAIGENGELIYYKPISDISGTPVPTPSPAPTTPIPSPTQGTPVPTPTPGAPCPDRDKDTLPKVYCYSGKINEPVESPGANNPYPNPTTYPNPTAYPPTNPNPPPSTGTELRFITVGDPQGETDRTRQVVDFINTANIDFAVFLGDYVSKDTVNAIKDNIQKPYYVVEGNHDTGNFNDYWGFGPAQYYKNVKGFQIVIPPFDWKNYNWNQVDKTAPTLVFAHTPVFPNCGTDDAHSSGFDMKSELDKLNMLAFYNGHTHTWKEDIVNNRLYVAEDSLSPGDRGSCHDGASQYVGYTTITEDGKISYTRLSYK